MKSMLPHECAEHPDYQADSPPKSFCPHCWANYLYYGKGLDGNDNWEDAGIVFAQHADAVCKVFKEEVMKEMEAQGWIRTVQH